MEEGEGRPRGKSSSVVLSPKCLGVGVVTVIPQSERSPAREDGAGHSCRAAGPRPARGSDNDREETGLGLRRGTFKGTGRRSPFPPEGLYSSSERGSRRRTRCSCVYETPAPLTARRSYVSEACVILSAAARSTQHGQHAAPRPAPRPRLQAEAVESGPLPASPPTLLRHHRCRGRYRRKWIFNSSSSFFSFE